MMTPPSACSCITALARWAKTSGATRFRAMIEVENFGETVALSAGGLGVAWSLASPLMMTLLLLKVSGVALLEQDIADRRPAYRDYAARTSAFIPWPPRRQRPQP